MTLTKKQLPIIRPEYIFPLLAAASLSISCILISNKKYFWNDELYSYYLLADQSFVHMLIAFHDRINNTPFLYFLTGWIWAKIFGSTELSLRLFSSLGFCVALTVTWIVLRRTYDFASTTIGVLLVFCTSELVLSQNVEARMYGLFLAFSALGVYQYDLLNRDLHNANLKSIKRKTWLNTIIHTAIIHTHLLGIFYSGAILLAQLFRDKYFKVFRSKIYFSIILSWISLFFYLPSFLNQASVGYPRSWIPTPTRQDLFTFLNAPSPSFLGLTTLTLIILLVGLKVLISHHRTKVGSSPIQLNLEKQNSEFSLLIVAYSFLTVPILVWFLSKIIKPIFIDRYMMPTILSWAILFVFLFSRTIFLNHVDHPQPEKFGFCSKVFNGNVFALLISATFLLYPFRYAADFPGQQRPGLNDGKYGYSDLPIVTQFSHDFTQRFHYSPQHSRYFFILDWEAALDEGSGLFTPQEYKHLDALKHNYPQYFSNHIVQSQEFLQANNHFLVLDSPYYDAKCGLQRTWENISCPQWLEKRILSNSNFRIKSLGLADSERILLLVENVSNRT
jgi:hypothetical protein